MGSSINLHVLTLRRRQTVRDELLSILPVYRLGWLSAFIIDLVNEPLCIWAPPCKPALGRNMLCIRKMDLVDLTARPFFPLFSDAILCFFILRMSVCGAGSRFPGLRCVFLTCSPGMCWVLVCVTAAGVCEELTDVVKAGAARPAVPSWCPHRDKNPTPPGWQQQREDFTSGGLCRRCSV